MNDNAKTYEDGVRAGFEACRDAAVAVCRATEKDFEAGAKGAASDDALLAATYRTCRNITRITGNHIAALTPESPND